MILSRRMALLGLLAAPAIIRPGLLMPIKRYRGALIMIDDPWKGPFQWSDTLDALDADHRSRIEWSNTLDAASDLNEASLLQLIQAVRSPMQWISSPT